MNRSAVWLVAAGVVNLVASLALLLPLRQGTMAGGSVAERMVFIAAHPVQWRVGWIAWMAATVALLGFFWAVTELLAGEGVPWGRLTLLLAAPGAALDLGHDALQAVAVLACAVADDHATFVLLDHVTVVIGGGVVNLAYGLAGLALAEGLRRSGAPRWLVTEAFALFATTLALALAGFAEHPALLVATTAATMGQFVLFAFLCGWRVHRHGRLGA